MQLFNKNFDDIRIMLNIVKQEIWKDNIDMYMFLVHDMKNLKTKLYHIERGKVKEYSFDVYTSRSEAITPIIERVV